MQLPRSIQLATFVVLVLFAAPSFAQNKEINPTSQLWSEIDLAGRLTKKIKWQLDFQYSRQSPYSNADMFKDNAQLTIRPWLHYYPGKHLRISAFYGLWYNFAIAEVGARQYPEYRGALQVNYYSTCKLNLFTNRFRIEYRDIKDRDGLYERLFRARYSLKYQRLLRHNSYDKNALYFVTFNELFANMGSKVTGYHFFDQNRLFMGIGYDITDDITFETGYFNQLQQHAHDNNFDMNHIWQLTLIIDNLNFSK